MTGKGPLMPGRGAGGPPPPKPGRRSMMLASLDQLQGDIGKLMLQHKKRLGSAPPKPTEKIASGAPAEGPMVAAKKGELMGDLLPGPVGRHGQPAQVTPNKKKRERDGINTMLKRLGSSVTRTPSYAEDEDHDGM
jgi:hypothetical protein